MIQASLAVLSLIQDELIDLDFGEINEYFKQFKEETADAAGQYKLLPETEKIIAKAHKFKITDERIMEIVRTIEAQEPQLSNMKLKVAARNNSDSKL